MDKVNVFTANPILLFTSVFKIPFLAILISLVLLVPTAAQALPISYQFHGEVMGFDGTTSEMTCPPTSVLCPGAINLGDIYTGSLLYDVDTIIENPSIPGFLGGIAFYSFVYDDFVLFSAPNDPLTLKFTAISTEAYSFTDEVSRGLGIINGADVVSLNLFPSSPDVIAGDGQFPVNLDDFNAGRLNVGLIEWSENIIPNGIGIFNASIEDFRRVVPAAVPAPAAIWLFGIGLIGLVGFSKRRKAA